MTVLTQGNKHPALSEGSRPCWALPSPVHERSGYRVSRPTGYKVMRSCRIVIHGPGLAPRLACHRSNARCGCAMIAPRSSRSRPLRAASGGGLRPALTAPCFGARSPPPTNDALLTTHSPYKGEGQGMSSRLVQSPDARHRPVFRPAPGLAGYPVPHLPQGACGTTGRFTAPAAPAWFGCGQPACRFRKRHPGSGPAQRRRSLG